MKTIQLLTALFALTSPVFAAGPHDRSEFTVDWNDAQTLAQYDNLDCPSGHNSVVLYIPGQLGVDFSVQDLPREKCFLANEWFNGSSTELLYTGECAGYDAYFVIRKLAAPAKTARIKLDIGC